MTWKFFDISLKCLFQLRCWLTITPMNLALFTRCTTSFCNITSFWGVRFFLGDNTVICVLFTLRVSLLELNHNATLANLNSCPEKSCFQWLQSLLLPQFSTYWHRTGFIVQRKQVRIPNYLGIPIIFFFFLNALQKPH